MRMFGITRPDILVASYVYLWAQLQYESFLTYTTLVKIISRLTCLHARAVRHFLDICRGAITPRRRLSINRKEEARLIGFDFLILF